MLYLIVGLGNPGVEYEKSRHNTGRIFLEYLRKANDFSDWANDKKLKALSSRGKIGKVNVLVLEPETFMNKSGISVKSVFIENKIGENLIVVYDDLDLPLGDFKISFNRGSGGHRGVESIIKTLKTREFVRIRIGVCPTTPLGKTNKPKGEEKVVDFLMGDFKKNEFAVLQKLSEKVNEAISMIILEGKEKAMGFYNQK